jgi:hypothetical protein
VTILLTAISKTICICGDGSRGGGGDGGWRCAASACGVRRAACDSGVWAASSPHRAVACGWQRKPVRDDGIGGGAVAADVLIMGGSDFP